MKKNKIKRIVATPNEELENRVQEIRTLYHSLKTQQRQYTLMSSEWEHIRKRMKHLRDEWDLILSILRHRREN